MNASEKEIKLIVDSPASYINRFFLTIDGGISKITYAEQDPSGKEIVSRGAICMSHGCALSLADLIQEVLKKPDSMVEQ